MDAAAKHENRYRAVIEYANGAMFNVAELDAWAASNKVPVSFETLLKDEHIAENYSADRHFVHYSLLSITLASRLVPESTEPSDAATQLMAAGDAAEYADPVRRLRDLVMVRYDRLLLSAVYDGDLNLYDTFTYTKIDVEAARLRYEANPEAYVQDGPGQPAARKPAEPASTQLSSSGQFILHTGQYASTSAGEIVLPADTANVTVNAAIGLTMSAATIQFPNYVNVYEREGMDANEAGEVKFEHMDGRAEAERLALRDFPAACQAIGIRPRNPYSPYANDYAGAPEQNVFYQVTVDELRKYAEPFGVTVRLEGAPSVAHTSDDASAQLGADLQSDQERCSSWQERARIIADELFDRDTANKCRDSLKGYAKRVMEEMQIRQFHGPRGRIDNPNTIQREALQGDKWWVSKGK
nr:hypothetical protein [Burkholderia ambifaria]